MEDRWVRLMPDVLSPGVWHCDGCAGAPEALPISAALIDKIREWQDWYDREESRHEAGTVFELADDWDIEGFAAFGLEIARQLKGELPPDWIVVYYDVSAAVRTGAYNFPRRKPEIPRHLYEFEV